MAYAVCKSCSTKIHWKASAGARLADRRCQCGGEFTAANALGQAASASTTGRKAIHCAVCGRRRLSASNYKITTNDAIYPAWGTAGKVLVDVPAGAVICWYHEPATQDMTSQ